MATSAPKPPPHCDDTVYFTEQPAAAAPAGSAATTPAEASNATPAETRPTWAALDLDMGLPPVVVAARAFAGAIVM
ncbi:hypothetical protein TPA0908_45030 [Micromonospora sp. AKA38]|nr:hypothetical protein TPA0908_45030 [Micromonospora sp. AKA38]